MGPVVASLLMFGGSSLLNYALASRPAKPEPPAKWGQLPTTDGGPPIPVVFGVGQVTQPYIFCEAYTHAGTFARGNKGEFQYPYYNAFEAMALCHGPVDELLDVSWGDISFASRPTVCQKIDAGDHWNYGFNDVSENFFGSDGDGIGGNLRVFKGGLSQSAYPGLLAALGVADERAYAGLSYAVLEGLGGLIGSGIDERGPLNAAAAWVGSSPTLRPLSFALARWPNTLGLTSNAHKILIEGSNAVFGTNWYDANWAAVAWECITDARWGLGAPESFFDKSQFLAMGNILATEGLGFSCALTAQEDGDSFLNSGMQHVDGMFRFNPTTGKLTPKLIRKDYTFGNLPRFGPAQLKKVGLRRSASSEVVNVVRVNFTDCTNNFQRRNAPAPDQARLQQAGVMVPQDVTMRGCSNPGVASKIACRMQAEESYPWAALNIEADRSMWSVRPGDPFVLDWPELLISGMVARTGNITLGPVDAPEIQVEAAEDVFGLPYRTYVLGAGGRPEREALPAVCARARLFPAPMLPEQSPRNAMLTLAAMGAGTAEGYLIQSRNSHEGGSLAQLGFKRGFALLGILSSALGPTTLGLTMTAPDSRRLLDALLQLPSNPTARNAGQRLLMLYDPSTNYSEICAFNTVTWDTESVCWIVSGLGRGNLDTVPRTWTTGCEVWFLAWDGQVGYGWDVPGSYPQDWELTAYAKLLPFNSRGVVAASAVTEISAVMSAEDNTARRAYRPWAPCNMAINNTNYPATVTGNLRVQCYPRNRLVTSDFFHANQIGMPGRGEPGTSIRITLWNAGAESPLRTVYLNDDGEERDDRDPFEYNYSTAAEMADNGGILCEQVGVEIATVRLDGSGGELDCSFTALRHIVTRV